MKLMLLHYITGVVCLFLCYAVDSIVTDCKPRNLKATGDDDVRLYIDGVEITNLPNANNWKIPDTVELPCNAKVIGIQGRDLGGVGSIMASTDDGYILTNSSWKCTNRGFACWQTIDFDDSDWPPAFDDIAHENSSELSASEIRKDARWIWTTAYKYEDKTVYCRKTLDINECLLGPPENQCVASSGNCINTFGSYKCHCHQGFTNVGDQRCEVSTGNDSASLIILGVFFGVSVLANIALVSVLLILHSRNKTTKNGGQIGVGKSTYQEGIAQAGDQNISRSSPAGKAHKNQKSQTSSQEKYDDNKPPAIE